jgi:DNA-binding transcriptional ArsR family regulator
MTTTTNTDPDAARREKTRQHFAWQQCVAERSDLSPTARLAAWALARRRNVLSGRCDPSYANIARGMGGMSERSAVRALAALERAGLIVVDRRVGRGRRNRVTFVMAEKVTELRQGFAAEKDDKPAAGRPPDGARKGDKPSAEKVTEPCHPNMKRASTKPSEHRERENAHAREASRSDARAPVGAASDKGEGRRGRAGGRPTERAKPADRKVEGGYLELRQIWVRPWPDADDREAWLAYDQAVGGGVRQGIILATAKAWVEAADAPRFLPSLAKWLACKGWEKPPPSRDRARQERPAHAPRSGVKVNMAAVIMAQGRAIKAARAGL